MQTSISNEVESVLQSHKHKYRKRLFNYLKALPFWLLIISFIMIILGMTLSVFFSAFGTEWFGTFLPEGYTFEWMKRAWVAYDIGSYYKITLKIVGVATIISLILSIPSAYVLARKQFPFKDALIGFYQLPFTLPELVYAIPIASIFYSIGLAETIPGLIIVNLIIGIPFSVFILIPFIESLDPRLEWAAQSLGANKWRMFTRIVFPQLIPGITAAAINIFIRMFSTFIIILLISGPKTQTLPVMVFSVLSSAGNQPPPMLDALALTLMFPLLLFAFISLWLSSLTQRRLGQ
ncbi:putative spermidine/putrescine transport system permease protein [Caldalkalibacillus uzonensis]|uniref:Spermidine/putrescine transport system permease protein n=1 Tax=Caldalkalibacillus uzonensis TaxID=353224 RepID=A0ABU0CQB5_9BACI|nr:ABC transporter permease subunit [Caldalkalibacillus uzonensis]MDQ0338608.1 putative spermidine/putrescine transport system permease protein [Caldalkalibacillus uzonensis]